MEHSPIILSILICHLINRSEVLVCLTNKLNKQIYSKGLEDKIEILIESDNGEMDIGTKRNILLSKASGKYISFIDDDDDISDNYITLIMKALESNPDCVGIKGILISKGENKIPFCHSIEFQGWYVGPDGYYRTPNHLNPVRKNIAVEIGFPCKNFGEDHYYSNGIKSIIKSEVYIDEPIYFYNKRNEAVRL